MKKSSSDKNKSNTYFDIPLKERKAIILRAAQKSNEAQAALMKEHGSK